MCGSIRRRSGGRSRSDRRRTGRNLSRRWGTIGPTERVCADRRCSPQGQLFDIDRVEVLRGPQGTLYGRNTTGGQINFISNRPTADPHAGLAVEYGSFNEFTSEGFFSGPLTEGLLGRLSFSSAQGGGWQRDRLSNAGLGDKNKAAVRAQLESDPASAANLLVNAHWSQDKSQETGLHLFDAYTPYNAGAGGPTIPADSSRYVTGWRLDPNFAQVTGLDPVSKPGVDNSNEGIDLTGNIDLKGAKITSITSYSRLIRREYGDWDGTQYFDSDEYFRSYLDVVSGRGACCIDRYGPAQMGRGHVLLRPEAK
jgi:iron complex outermembrane recepter protein